MDSIFVLTKTNFDYFKSPMQPTGNYWLVKNRICYHYCSDPEFIFHNQIPLTKSMKYMYEDYLHVDAKKPLYCMSHYSVDELKDMCTRMHQPIGLKKQMYEIIKKEIETNKN
jgi:hypothetical protein